MPIGMAASRVGRFRPLDNPAASGNLSILMAADQAQKGSGQAGAAGAAGAAGGAGSPVGNDCPLFQPPRCLLDAMLQDAALHPLELLLGVAEHRVALEAARLI